MNIRENLLEDKHFLLQTLAELAEIERDRIVSSGLPKEFYTKEQLCELAKIL